ncbi:DNA-binding protein [Alkalicoccobacillus gibsonii]|uniref:DNA-binding protein n=1 Tax=Alkalicoccobacillus gibsonii TaxID=79881 RepID=UPI0035181A15
MGLLGFWLAVGIIGFGYYIGDGLKYFKQGKPKRDYSDEISYVENFGQPELIKESKVHQYTGISKEDAKTLVKDYPSVPHLKVNGQIYFPLKKLKAWIDNLPNA